jgi:hypothetical protein
MTPLNVFEISIIFYIYHSIPKTFLINFFQTDSRFYSFSPFYNKKEQNLARKTAPNHTPIGYFLFLFCENYCLFFWLHFMKDDNNQKSMDTIVLLGFGRN